MDEAILSTRTHFCLSFHVEICRDTNAARNILSRRLEIIGIERNQGTEGFVTASRNLLAIGNALGDKVYANDGQLDLVSMSKESLFVIIPVSLGQGVCQRIHICECS